MRAEEPIQGRVHLALLVTQVAFASLAVEGKLAMAPPCSVSPLALAMTRILGGALVFAIIASASRSPKVTSVRDRLRLAGLSIFGIVLNQALFLAGLSRTSPMSATLLVATIPIFTTAVAVLARKERLTVRSVLGIACALFGIATLSGFALPASGDALVLLNAMSFAVYVVFAKDVLERYGTWTSMAWVFGSGAVLFAPIGGVALAHDAPRWTREAIELVAFVVLVPTLLGYGLSAWALKRAKPTVVTIYVYIQPIIVAVLARIQLDQPVPARAIAASIFIFGGVAVVATSRSRGYTERHG